MTLEDLKAELQKLSPKDFAEIQAWMEERVLEAELKRRIDEAEKDPSILISHEEVMAQVDRIGEKHGAPGLSSRGQ